MAKNKTFSGQMKNFWNNLKNKVTEKNDNKELKNTKTDDILSCKMKISEEILEKNKQNQISSNIISSDLNTSFKNLKIKFLLKQIDSFRIRNEKNILNSSNSYSYPLSVPTSFQSSAVLPPSSSFSNPSDSNMDLIPFSSSTSALINNPNFFSSSSTLNASSSSSTLKSEKFNNEVKIYNNEDLILFSKLPSECIEEIFKFLSPKEIIRCGEVSKRWNQISRSSTLWKKVDLSQIVVPFKSKRDRKENFENEDNIWGEENKKEEMDKYCERERKRILEFVDHLVEINPCIEELHVCVDIGDTNENWGEVIKKLIQGGVKNKLKKVFLNWKENPWKPNMENLNTWNSYNCNDLIYKHRRRQRQFITFFDNFTSQVLNLESLTLPFVWSPTSVSHLCRLGSSLRELNLIEYFVPQSFDQNLLTSLLQGLPHLEKLSLQLDFGKGSGVESYVFDSSTLKSLDISKCQGILISNFELPSLNSLKTGPLTFLGQLIFSSSQDLLHNSLQQEQTIRSASLSSPSPFPASPALSRQHKRLQISSSTPSSSSSISPTSKILLSELPPLISSSSSSSNTSSTPLLSSPSPLLSKQNSLFEPPTLLIQQLTHQKSTSSSSYSHPFQQNCLISLIRNGAPNLKKINQYEIKTNCKTTFKPNSLHLKPNQGIFIEKNKLIRNNDNNNNDKLKSYIEEENEDEGEFINRALFNACPCKYHS